MTDHALATTGKAMIPNRQFSGERVLIITGGRDYRDAKTLRAVMNRLHPDRVIQGGCETGADRIARQWCDDREVVCENYPGLFRTHGRPGGPMRNRKMACRGSRYRREGDAVLVIYTPGNAGTDSMIFEAQKEALPMMPVDDALSVERATLPWPWGERL